MLSRQLPVTSKDMSLVKMKEYELGWQKCEKAESPAAGEARKTYISDLLQDSKRVPKLYISDLLQD